MESVEIDVNKEIKIEVPWEEELLCDQKVANEDTGQLIAECPFDVFNFPKKQQKKLTSFCPRI